MKKLKLFFGVVISIVFVSCTSNTFEEISPKQDGLQIVTNPTYQNNIKQIIDVNCVSCHSPSGINQTPFLRDYNEVKGAIVSGTLLCRINGTCGPVMPQTGKMPQATISLIELWKTQGYVN